MTPKPVLSWILSRSTRRAVLRDMRRATPTKAEEPTAQELDVDPKDIDRAAKA
jgi:hypothetical protein